MAVVEPEVKYFEVYEAHKQSALDCLLTEINLWALLRPYEFLSGPTFELYKDHHRRQKKIFKATATVRIPDPSFKRKKIQKGAGR